MNECSFYSSHNIHNVSKFRVIRDQALWIGKFGFAATRNPEKIFKKSLNGIVLARSLPKENGVYCHGHHTQSTVVFSSQFALSDVSGLKGLAAARSLFFLMFASFRSSFFPSKQPNLALQEVLRCGTIAFQLHSKVQNKIGILL